MGKYSFSDKQDRRREERRPKRNYTKRRTEIRAKEERLYIKLSKKFLEDNPVCQFPHCNSFDVTVHHAKGRKGKLLIDIRYFKSLCWIHHFYMEVHPAEAKEYGFSLNRLI